MYCLVGVGGLQINQKFKTMLLAVFIRVIRWVHRFKLDIQSLS